MSSDEVPSSGTTLLFNLKQTVQYLPKPKKIEEEIDPEAKFENIQSEI